MVNRRDFIKSSLLTMFSGLILLNLPRRAGADIPDVQQIEDISQDTQGKIKVQIRHLGPNAIHYVDIVEVEVDGQIQQFTLEPQNTNPFTADLEIGEINGTPSVRARAHCILHGWGVYSTQVQIPEFPSSILALLGALVTALFILRRSGKK